MTRRATKAAARVATHVWLGEVRILGYDVVIIDRTERDAQRKLIAEHQRQHRAAKTGTHVQTWDDLVNETEASVREIEIGKAVWP